MTGLPYQRRDAAARIASAMLVAVTGLGVPLSGAATADPIAGSGPAVRAQGAGAGPATGTPIPAGALAGAAPLTADKVRDDQWQLDQFSAAAAWKLATGKGVTVAVVDSGVDGSHPDLVGQVLPGIDLVKGSGTGQTDPVGHGTTVAGLIAGRNDDRRGVLGLAPEAKILPVRVLDDKNRYDDAMVVARGVRWAVDNGARVVNLSLGGNGESPALAAALDYAFARDVVVVACTGNVGTAGGSEVWYPAREPGVIAVAGTERDTDSLWSGSITGRETVLTAPATGLTGARPGGFWRVQGTSFAAPLVTASAALLRSRWPAMSAGDVINRLIGTARDLGAPGRDDRYGFGMVDPVAALRGGVPTVNHNPLDDGSAPPGVAGFGPATERSPSSDPALGAPNPLDVPDPRNRTRWAPLPAGAAAGSSSVSLWLGGAVLVVVLTGALFAIRRSVRRRPGPTPGPGPLR